MIKTFIIFKYSIEWDHASVNSISFVQLYVTSLTFSLLFFWQNKCLVLFIHYIVTSNYFNNTPMTTNGITSQGPKPDFFLFLARDDRMIIFITVLALQFSIECLLCQSEVHERDWLLFDLCLCFSLSLRELENCSSICFLEKAKCWYLYDDTLILSLSRASL